MFNYPVGLRYLYTWVSPETSAEVIGHYKTIEMLEDIEMLTPYSWSLFFYFSGICSKNDKL